MTADASRVPEPERRPATAMLAALRQVRGSPELAAWFTAGEAATTVEDPPGGRSV